MAASTAATIVGVAESSSSGILEDRADRRPDRGLAFRMSDRTG